MPSTDSGTNVQPKMPNVLPRLPACQPHPPPSQTNAVRSNHQKTPRAAPDPQPTPVPRATETREKASPPADTLSLKLQHPKTNPTTLQTPLPNGTTAKKLPTAGPPTPKGKEATQSPRCQTLQSQTTTALPCTRKTRTCSTTPPASPSSEPTEIQPHPCPTQLRLLVQSHPTPVATILLGPPQHAPPTVLYVTPPIPHHISQPLHCSETSPRHRTTLVERSQVLSATTVAQAPFRGNHAPARQRHPSQALLPRHRY